MKDSLGQNDETLSNQVKRGIKDHLDCMPVNSLANQKGVVLHKSTNQVKNIDGISLTVDSIEGVLVV